MMPVDANNKLSTLGLKLALVSRQKILLAEKFYCGKNSVCEVENGGK
ncbi:hypothetical protein N9414_00360 [Nodularia spumigena CCY9414]|jgi:hypothetical protein|nr:hypothetical protein N9414_00360 [Nodularia spumigena CCY9414]